MLKKVAIALIAVFVGVLIAAALQPATFQIERRTSIRASDNQVFALINDFHQWANWSPWEKMDPKMTKTFTGAPAGQGSVYAWKGNDKVGEGRMTLVESRPNTYIKIKLEFFKPWTATNTAEFKLKPSGDDVSLSWSMTGQHNFVGKLFSLFMSMDKMVGKDFEKGLAGIKGLAEK